MQGRRHSVTAADGVRIGLLSAGAGPGLLLVHGGMGQIERWEPVWDALSEHWSVTAMDRRGRGSSGDSDQYDITCEYDDIVAVATDLAREQHAPIDVFAHSYGATATIGAAQRHAPFRRIVLYEPPDASTVTDAWVRTATTMIAEGQTGRAMVRFLSEIIGLSDPQIQILRDTPMAYDILSVAAATLPREARTLLTMGHFCDVADITLPVLLLVGAASPTWALTTTHALEAQLPNASVVVLPEVGHEAIDAVPELVVRELQRLLAPSP